MDDDFRDIKIIESLRRNCRSRLIDISKETDVPVSTVYNRINALQSSLIEKFTCMLDYDSLGFGVLATLLIKVQKNNRELLAKYLEKKNCVNNLYQINNGYDFLVDTVFRTIKELESLREDIEHNYKAKTQVYYVMEKLKEESFIPRI